MNQTRFDEIYERLVEETENPATLTNKRKHDALEILLDVFEYLRDNSDDNPLDDIFE